MERIKNYFQLLGMVIMLFWKRVNYSQLYFLISTPYYGNVGDHTIELAEQEMICQIGMKKCTIDINYYEYGVLRKLLIKIIRSDDVILIDGGGNFGDTWPETQERINDILDTYKYNRILVFPESWYFSDTTQGEDLLKKTKKSLENCKNVVLYARDSWSYGQMKENITGVDIRLVFDCVFYKTYSPIDIPKGKTVVGLALREDKESKNVELKQRVIKYLEEKHIQVININNDSYEHVPKSARKEYFNSIINQYEESTVVITDRFHGLVFSIIARRPCLFYDNSTGKIAHFYADIKDIVNGCVESSNNSFNESEIDQIIKKDQITVDNLFYDKCNRYKMDIKKTLYEWRISK